MKKIIFGVILYTILINATDEGSSTSSVSKEIDTKSLTKLDNTYQRIQDLNVSLSKRFTKLKKVIKKLQKDFDSQDCLEQQQAVDRITLELRKINKKDKNYQIFLSTKNNLQKSKDLKCKDK
ncbi:MAG TPA: hypothetical protein EYG73_00360 [Arcobacter sp.]|nr:hypothetical protein [Arcobacter sp.]